MIKIGHERKGNYWRVVVGSRKTVDSVINYCKLKDLIYLFYEDPANEEWIIDIYSK